MKYYDEAGLESEKDMRRDSEPVEEARGTWFNQLLSESECVSTVSQTQS